MRVALCVWAACAVGVLAGCATVRIQAQAPRRVPITPGSVPRPYVDFAHGPWTATGTVETAPNSADSAPGERLVRPWWFVNSCHPKCRIMFIRETEYGTEETPVVVGLLDSHSAEFPPSPVPCAHYTGEDAGSAEDTSTFLFWWSENHQVIHASERTTTTSDRCPAGPSLTSWVAVRSDPTASPPAPGF